MMNVSETFRQPHVEEKQTSEYIRAAISNLKNAPINQFVSLDIEVQIRWRDAVVASLENHPQTHPFSLDLQGTVQPKTLFEAFATRISRITNGVIVLSGGPEIIEISIVEQKTAAESDVSTSPDSAQDLDNALQRQKHIDTINERLKLLKNTPSRYFLKNVLSYLLLPEVSKMQFISGSNTYTALDIVERVERLTGLAPYCASEPPTINQIPRIIDFGGVEFKRIIFNTVNALDLEPQFKFSEVIFEGLVKDSKTITELETLIQKFITLDIPNDVTVLLERTMPKIIEAKTALQKDVGTATNIVDRQDIYYRASWITERFSIRDTVKTHIILQSLRKQ